MENSKILEGVKLRADEFILSINFIIRNGDRGKITKDIIHRLQTSREALEEINITICSMQNNSKMTDGDFKLFEQHCDIIFNRVDNTLNNIIKML